MRKTKSRLKYFFVILLLILSSFVMTTHSKQKDLSKKNLIILLQMFDSSLLKKEIQFLNMTDYRSIRDTWSLTASFFSDPQYKIPENNNLSYIGGYSTIDKDNLKKKKKYFKEEHSVSFLGLGDPFSFDNHLYYLDSSQLIISILHFRDTSYIELELIASKPLLEHTDEIINRYK